MSNQKALVERLISLSKLAAKKTSVRDSGRKYVEVYKKTCDSYRDCDIEALNTVISQLDADLICIRQRCIKLTLELLSNSMSQYAFVDRGILSHADISDGYLLLVDKKVKPDSLVEILSKEEDEHVKVLLLTGETPGEIVDWKASIYPF